MEIREQSLPTSKYDARSQGYSPRKPSSCDGTLKTVVLQGEKWYKCFLTTDVEPEQTPKPDEDKPNESSGEKLDKEVEELEKDIISIDDSKTALRVKEKWNKLWDNAKKTGAAAATELELLRLRQKIEAAEKKLTAGSSTQNFIDCTGWNKMGCKSESIRKVQTCFNLAASGNFDKNLSNELAKYASTFAYKDGFNDSDVEKICRFKNEEDKKVMLQQQKQAELERFRRQYPQQTTKASTIDEL
jgi:hypothetical protein